MSHSTSSRTPRLTVKSTTWPTCTCTFAAVYACRAIRRNHYTPHQDQ